MLTFVLQSLSLQPARDRGGEPDSPESRIRAEREFLAELADPPSAGHRRRLWQRFFEEYHPVVVWAARNQGITVQEDREDLWAELLVKLMRNDCRIIRRFLNNPDYPDVSFKAYLRKAAVNLARGRHRKHSRRPQEQLEPWMEAGATSPGGVRQPGTADPAALDYGSRWTNQFIDWLLPERSSSSYRVFALKALGGLSNNEISVELDISAANVAQKIHYFKVKLISALLGTLPLSEPEAQLLDARRTVLLGCLRLSDSALRWWQGLVAALNPDEEPHTDRIFPLKEADYEFPFISKVVNRKKQWVSGRFDEYRRLVESALADLRQARRNVAALLDTGQQHIDKVFGSGTGDEQ